MFEQIFKAFLSKVVEQIADNVLNNVNSTKDFEPSLKTLQENLKSLSAKASDVEEEIKNAELSGRKKRKREVKKWLGDVNSIKREVGELGTQVESRGFVKRLMDGGKIAKLNNEVESLVEQSRYFDELVLDVCGNRGETFLTDGLVGEGFNENLEKLKYSFDQLNRNHHSHGNELNTFQLCFLYCSLYPGDFEISREDLVEKFISEGLVGGKSREAQARQGHSILEKLVDVCLLESGVKFYEYVKMHDLVRSMALKMSEGKYMVRCDASLVEIPKREEWTKGLEKVSLMYNDIRGIGDRRSPNCPKLSTLLLCDNQLENSHYSVAESVPGLKSLKALLLKNCDKLEKVPNLGMLKALRELNLSGTAIVEVSQGVEELPDLKLLAMDAPKLKMLPRGLLLNLVHLQFVNLPFHIQVPIEGTENLKQLEEFSGRLKNVTDFNCFIARGGEHVTRFAIVVGSNGTTFYTTGGKCGLSYQKELALSEYNLKDEKVLGHDIDYLTIRKCEGLSMSFVDDFSSLQRLGIENCGGVECIMRSGQRLASQISILELAELEDLKGVIERGEIGTSSAALAQVVLRYLMRIRIRKCNKMRKLGLPVLEVPNLMDLQIEECEEIEEIFEDEGRDSVTLPKLKWLKLSKLPNLRKLGLPVLGVPNLDCIKIEMSGRIEEIFEDEGTHPSTLLKLQELRLTGLTSLKSVCKATLTCNSIERIFILGCPDLVKKWPLHVDVPPPTTLAFIQVEREWWKSLEWDNPNLPHLLHPIVDYKDSTNLSACFNSELM